MDLVTLKDRADQAGREFDAIALLYYPDARWGAYRAFECNQPVPAQVCAAMENYHSATHAYYLARDGDAGFLGAHPVGH